MTSPLFTAKNWKVRRHESPAVAMFNEVKLWNKVWPVANNTFFPKIRYLLHFQKKRAGGCSRSRHQLPSLTTWVWSLGLFYPEEGENWLPQGVHCHMHASTHTCIFLNCTTKKLKLPKTKRSTTPTELSVYCELGHWRDTSGWPEKSNTFSSVL